MVHQKSAQLEACELSVHRRSFFVTLDCLWSFANLMLGLCLQLALRAKYEKEHQKGLLMRTRQSKKAPEGDSGLYNFLRSLHENDTATRAGDGTAAPETLADASRQVVDQLLDWVGSKRKKRLGASTKTTIEGLPGGRAATSELVCGIRARITHELEQIRQPELLPQS